MIDDDYIVFKKNDVKKYMTSGEKFDLETFQLLITKNREQDGKTTNVFKELIDDL